MSGSKITALSAGTCKNGDLHVAVDVTDTSMAPTGTDKKYTLISIKDFINTNVIIDNGTMNSVIIGATIPALATFIDVTLTGASYSTAGVVHNNSSGVLSSSLIVNADITASTITGAKLAASTVANSNLSTMPTMTIKGNNTGGTANPSDLTVSEVKTMLGIVGSVTLTVGQVGFGDSSNNLVGSANLLWDNTAGALLIGAGSLDATAQLQMNSTTKLFYEARMTTTQRLAITPSIEGGQCYDTTLHQWFGWNGTAWAVLG